MTLKNSVTNMRFLGAGDQCECEYTATCSCQSAMKFMECVSKSCASGKCNCPADGYQSSCQTLADACGKLDFKCTAGKTECVNNAIEVDEEKKNGEEAQGEGGTGERNARRDPH